MTISREKCLEMARDIYATDTSNYWSEAAIDRLEALINRAYREGARDMRERAAKEIEDCSLEVVTRAVAAIEIRNLEIE